MAEIQSIKDELIALKTLQDIDTEIDNLYILRGELPLEIEDLSDEVAGLKTRIDNNAEEMKENKSKVVEFETKMTEANALVDKYQKQIDNVKNSREFSSLSKEIEFQKLEIELCEKKVKDTNTILKAQRAKQRETKNLLTEIKENLTIKKKELDQIIAETQEQEEMLNNKKVELKGILKDRLVSAYERIRKNSKNGFAVVNIKRDACGGCFNHVTPQRLLDINQHSKIIACEYCGRILVNKLTDEPEVVEEAPKKKRRPKKLRSV
jgi:predicted  nucleic acid-binding Zn-ribbon protein